MIIKYGVAAGNIRLTTTSTLQIEYLSLEKEQSKETKRKDK